ncbi:MAG: CBS domain-containing protein, partial [Elusimicrobia bacterium]|nr:CBS domain-containing protein [Elusimicrobiota bacterium]MBD3412746.1 CBS domain-containing protein [Elusimicrobiota bacterium]
MLVSDAMIRNVISIRSDANARKLLDIFLIHRIDALPVIDRNDKLIGYVPLEHLAEKLMPRFKEIIKDFACLQDYGQLEKIFEVQWHLVEEESNILVSDCMINNVVAVRDSESLISAAALMVTHNLRRLPVID